MEHPKSSPLDPLLLSDPWRREGNRLAGVVPPKRRSGRDIVAAVLDAAEQILAEEGGDALNTNRLARVAGVSVGSVYQYFANKQAVVAELARRLEDRAVQIAAPLFEQVSGLGLEDSVEAITVGLLTGSMGAARMRRTVLLEVPRVWTRDASLSVDEATQKLVREVFERNAKQLRDGDLEVMTFVIHHAVEKVIESAVLWRPELLDAPAFRHELSHLVLSYVQRSERTPPVGQ